MSYCGNCGAELIPNAKFCGNCGTPQQSQQVQSSNSDSPQSFNASNLPIPPPPSPENEFSAKTPLNVSKPKGNGENVVGVISLRKMKSLGRSDSFAGVVTNHRLILAQLTSQMVSDAATQARAKAKAEGKGFFGQWGDQLKATFTYIQKYRTMDPSAIVAETPGNFAISNGSISEIKLKLKDISRDEYANESELEININSAQGQYKFRTSNQKETVTILKNVYGDRVKTPFGFSHGIRFFR